jgi:membrane-bound serine protease (ClpP class)
MDLQSALIVVALVVAGLVFIIVEILTPTFGVVALMSVAALAGAIWVAFDANQWFGITTLAVLLVGVPFYVVGMVRYLPRSPIGRRFFLAQAAEAEAAAVPEADQLRSFLGRETVAETDLRPSGTVRIDGHRVVATAESGLIERGTKVKVISTTVSNVIVRRVEQA